MPLPQEQKTGTETKAKTVIRETDLIFCYCYTALNLPIQLFAEPIMWHVCKKQLWNVLDTVKVYKNHCSCVGNISVRLIWKFRFGFYFDRTHEHTFNTPAEYFDTERPAWNGVKTTLPAQLVISGRQFSAIFATQHWYKKSARCGETKEMHFNCVYNRYHIQYVRVCCTT